MKNKKIAEHPTLEKRNWTYSMNIVYPNQYYGGAYSLAPLIFYNIVNKLPNWRCERKFLGDKINDKLIGFSFQYELDCSNFFKILRANKISLIKDREEIIFAGGPCVNLNWKPLAKYIDFFVLGEAENIIPLVLKEYESFVQDKNKKNFLANISKIDGVFVPIISEVEKYAVCDLNFDDYPIIQPLPLKLDKMFVFGSSFILEIERGCPFACKFCPMSKLHRSVRYREEVEKIIDSGIKINKRKHVVIYSASFTHPRRKEILKYLLDKKLSFSVPSIKVEVIDEELLGLIRAGGQRSLTIAPECNEALRQSIGKHVTDERFFDFARLSKELGFRELKLYFMLGLPNQSDKDIKEMAAFIVKMKKIFGKIYLSVNPFVPKPKTLFSEHRFDANEINKQIKLFKSCLKDVKVRYKIGNVRKAKLEWNLAFSGGLENKKC